MKLSSNHQDTDGGLVQQAPQPIQTSPQERTILFVGNITQDTVITYNKSAHPFRDDLFDRVVTQSLGGSVMFGCLAFQHYMKETNSDNDNCFDDEENSSLLFQPRIFTKIGKTDVQKLLRFFENRDLNVPSPGSGNTFGEDLLDFEAPEHVNTLQPDVCIVKKLRGLKMFENIMVVDGQQQYGSSATVGSSKLTQYELCYPPVIPGSTNGNQRTLKCLDRGSVFQEDDIHTAIKYQLENMSNLEALFFVPVAAEFDHLFVKKFSEHVKKDSQDILVCTDIQGYLRKIGHDGEVSHNNFDYLQEVLSTLSQVVSIIKLDHEEAKKCIPNSHTLSPEECALILQEKYSYPIVAVTMGSGGCVCSCRGNSINFGSESSSDNFASIVKYFPAYKPRRVMDETGAGDTFLSCFVAELLTVKHQKTKLGENVCYSADEIFECVKMAASATSYRVEERGLNGFASRDQAKHRVNTQIDI